MVPGLHGHLGDPIREVWLRASTKVVGGERSLLGEPGLPVPGLLLVLNHVHSIHRETLLFKIHRSQTGLGTGVSNKKDAEGIQCQDLLHWFPGPETQQPLCGQGLKLGQLPWLQVCWMGAFILEQMPQMPTYSEVNLLCCLFRAKIPWGLSMDTPSHDPPWCIGVHPPSSLNVISFHYALFWGIGHT